jgi:hypothetical protein
VLRLNRHQLRWVVGLLTGHCQLKGHLFKLGLTDDPISQRCLEEDESATHILCDCEAVASCKISSLGPVFHGTKWLLWHPIYKVLHFIQSVGLIKGSLKVESQWIIEGRGARVGFYGPPLYIHTSKQYLFWMKGIILYIVN